MLCRWRTLRPTCPEVIAAEIVEDLQAAPDEFNAIASTLSAREVAT